MQVKRITIAKEKHNATKRCRVQNNGIDVQPFLCQLLQCFS